MGVIELVAEDCYKDLRLDKYLTECLPENSRSFYQNLIAQANVLVNGQAERANYRIRTGDQIHLELPEPEVCRIEAEDIPLDILYEDKDVLIVNKPKGMVVHPSPGHGSGTLVNAVMYHCRDELSGINGEIRPGIVHRIDRDTTGALIVCKNDQAHIKIAKQIEEHTVNRTYRGIVRGVVKADEGTVNAPIGRHRTDRKKMAIVPNGREAVTHYRVLERFREGTYMEFQLETGRTHQIRVHMASIHHPLLGDQIYGNPRKTMGLTGQTLHAMTIGFVHPTYNRYMEFQAPLPEYFEKLLLKYRQ